MENSKEPCSRLAIEGGTPTRRAPWPSYDKGDVELSEDDEFAALRALRSRRLFRYDNRGYPETEVGALERELATFFGTKYALACASGTTAIALSLMAIGVGRGDQVLCPAFTFAATPSAILMTGAKPVVVEVNEHLHMDTDDLEKKLTRNVKAIVVVHMRGFACNIQEIMRIAASKGVPVIEDAVPALGVEIDGQKLGTFGKAGAFSTQSDKTINTGEGGFLVTSDADLYAKAVVMSGAYERRLRHHIEMGAVRQDLQLPIFSFRMDEIRAAIARNQLKSLPDRITKFRENYSFVADGLVYNNRISVRAPIKAGFLGESLIFRLPKKSPEKIKWFLEALRAEGIEARWFGDESDLNVRCFWNWRFQFPGLSEPEIKALLPKSALYISEAIDIPLSITLKRSDCNDLLSALWKVTAALGDNTPFHSFPAKQPTVA